MISQRTRYALKALTFLAKNSDSGPKQVTGIADAENIPRKFLEAIMADMKRGGLVVATRGKFGGYVLARPPEKITYGEIMRIIDGPLALVPCVSKQFYRRCEDCADEVTCAIRQIMAGVREDVSAILDNTTLAYAASISGNEEPAGVPAL
jgi:Rrf2 family protein